MCLYTLVKVNIASFLCPCLGLEFMNMIILLVVWIDDSGILLEIDAILTHFASWSFNYLQGLYVRSRLTINPDKVYRMAMRRLNTAAGILEVMGAPLAGTDLRAYVMSGGGLTLKDFKPKLRSKRCFLIFPIHGSERKGLVSVLVKKNKGEVCFYLSNFFCKLQINCCDVGRNHSPFSFF